MEGGDRGTGDGAEARLRGDRGGVEGRRPGAAAGLLPKDRRAAGARSAVRGSGRTRPTHLYLRAGPTRLHSRPAGGPEASALDPASRSGGDSHRPGPGRGARRDASRPLARSPAGMGVQVQAGLAGPGRGPVGVWVRIRVRVRVQVWVRVWIWVRVEGLRVGSWRQRALGRRWVAVGVEPAGEGGWGRPWGRGLGSGGGGAARPARLLRRRPAAPPSPAHCAHLPEAAQSRSLPFPRVAAARVGGLWCPSPGITRAQVHRGT